jgi:predicted DNA binding protein
MELEKIREIEIFWEACLAESDNHFPGDFDRVMETLIRFAATGAKAIDTTTNSDQFLNLFNASYENVPEDMISEMEKVVLNTAHKAGFFDA